MKMPVASASKKIICISRCGLQHAALERKNRFFLNTGVQVGRTGMHTGSFTRGSVGRQVRLQGASGEQEEALQEGHAPIQAGQAGCQNKHARPLAQCIAHTFSHRHVVPQSATTRHCKAHITFHTRR